MSKAQELPRGLQYRGKNIVAVFALTDGSIERRSLGQKSIPDAEAELILFKQAVRNGSYQKRQKKQKAPKATPAAAEVPVLVRDLWAGYIQNYVNEGGRDRGRQQIAWDNLEPTFGAVPVMDVTTGLCRDYIGKRQAQKISNGTVNRELSVLKAMFSDGTESTTAGARPLVDRMPTWPKKLKEGAPRKRFLTDEEHTRFMQHAKFWLRAFLETDYTFGFRKSELLNLRRNQVDLDERVIRLEALDTKTGEARTVAMTERVFQYLDIMCTNKKPDAFVFTRENGDHVCDMRDDWQAAAVKAGLGMFTTAKGKNGEYEKYQGINPHDLRRSACRNAKRRGVSDRLIMEQGGWTGYSTMQRYNITDEADLKDAAKKIENGRKVVFVDPQLNDPNFTATASKPN
jgi:integrase